MKRNLYIIALLFIFPFCYCNKKKSPNSQEGAILKISLQEGQELIYDIQYTYDLNKPINIGKQNIYYRNIYQNIRIKILKKNRDSYLIYTQTRHLRWEDYNIDSLLVAIYDSKYKHLNIGYGENFTPSIEAYISRIDTTLINNISNFSGIDTFSYVPFFFNYPRKQLAISDSFTIELPIGKQVLYIDTIVSNQLFTHFTNLGTNNLSGKYVINKTYGNISEGKHVYSLENNSKYRRVTVTFNQMK